MSEMKYFVDCACDDADAAAGRRGFTIVWVDDSGVGQCSMSHPQIGRFDFACVAECLRWLRAFELGWISGRECPDIDLLPEDDSCVPVAADDDVELILDDDPFDLVRFPDAPADLSGLEEAMG